MMENLMKILIADDHELFLKGLELILSDLDKNVDISLAHNYTEIFDILAQKKKFDLIVTDLAMPGANWLEAIKHIHQQLPETPIIILSAVFDKEIVQKTIELGAAGYIPKTSSNAVIMSAVRLVLSGGAYIPPELLNNSLKSQFSALEQISPEFENKDNKITLTPRQIDVLKLMAQGYSNKIIAHELGLSEGTVKLHVTAILKILNVYNRTGAVVEATKRGIISKNG